MQLNSPTESTVNFIALIRSMQLEANRIAAADGATRREVQDSQMMDAAASTMLPMFLADAVLEMVGVNRDQNEAIDAVVKTGREEATE